MIFQDAFAGFALGLSLILAIGGQNVFVLRQGLKRSHVFAVCFTCALSDAILISIGVGGFHLAAPLAERLGPLLTAGGAVFLIIYGALSLWRAIWPGETMKVGNGELLPLGSVLATCLAFTWLNPHVYLDTVVLLGAISAQYTSRIAFGTGAVMASFFFFFSLGYGAVRMAHLFESRSTWRILNLVIAVIMWMIALKLLIAF